MQQPYVIYGADVKRGQGSLTVSQVLEFEEIQHALAHMQRWTKPIRAGVARILSNRTSFIRTGASASENLQFDQLMHKVEKCMDTDSILSATSHVSHGFRHYR
jgi:hypothetical protein